MHFTFENQGTNTYLVYQVDAADEIDSMSLGMLTNNSIYGFAPAVFTQMDTDKFIKFNVSAKVSASQLFTGAVNQKRLTGVFLGIVNAMISAEDYMLDTNNILLDLDYIFADVSTCETVVVCLPVMNPNQNNPELGVFFKNIIFNTQFDQTENCDYIAKILNYLNCNPVISLAAFKQLLEGLNKPAVSSTAPVRPVPENIVQPVAPKPSGAVPAASAGNVAAQVKERTEHSVQNIPSPAQPTVPRPAVPVAVETNKVASEKPMSMFYLLQHYNKENAAIYKAQKQAKKAKNKEPSGAAPAKPVPAPGASVNTTFAVPGQPAKPEQAFAVPGQQMQATLQPASMTAAAVKPEVKPVPVHQNPVPPVQTMAPEPQYVSRPISFGETTVLSGRVGETTVLSAVVVPVKSDPHLIRVKNSERIPLNKPVFRLGKERSYVDYFINDNTAVSRSHANIISRDGEYYIVDTNSTNHTYVNGAMIQSNEEVKMEHDTKIRLGNEDFVFKLH